jgi:glycosyltransferase involved in cell wall biosynthesis
MDAERRQSLLFLDKIFLRPRKTNLRGVELFNLSLVRDLSRNGFALTIPAHHSWQHDFPRESFPSPVVFHKVPGNITLFNGLNAAWYLRRQPYQKIILANVANGLIPALLLLRIFKRPFSLIVFAHRMPSPRFMAALPKKATRVICVNGIIAAEFKKHGFGDVRVLFGHMNAGKFHPEKETGQKLRPEKTGDKINFCVVGFLDNAWKGADTALAAFRALPEDISAKCILHLASYCRQVSFPEPNIRAYDWLPANEMPQWLRRMDVMIVPSRDEEIMRETFSLTMVEGMLTGLPIIASNLPILAEKLDAGGGYTFRDTNELSRLMATLASRPELRAELGGKARQIALERYVWDTGKFIRLYLA